MRFSCLLLAGAGAQTTPGFQFLGSGYDLLQGNPISTQGLGDPGMRTVVFDFTDKEGRRTPDGKWEVPDKTFSVMLPYCSLHQNHSIIHSGHAYLKILLALVEFDAVLNGTEFKAGFDFIELALNAGAELDVFAQVSSLCAVYHLGFSMWNAPAVTSDFAAGVRSLPAIYDEEAYMEFLTVFGTHVVTELDAGGRWLWQMDFGFDAYVNMVAEHIDVDAGISYSGLVKAGFGVNVSQYNVSMEAVANATLQSQMANTGGEFTPNLVKWIFNVKNNPMPVGLHLASIDRLLQSSFVADPQIALKRASMLVALGKYCPYLAKQNPKVNCTPTAPVPGLPAAERSVLV